jgi:hypothetical protein
MLKLWLDKDKASMIPHEVTIRVRMWIVTSSCFVQSRKCGRKSKWRTWLQYRDVSDGVVFTAIRVNHSPSLAPH